MSVAFTREEDGEATAAHLPDRPISKHPNLVTEAGLRELDEALASARAAYVAAQRQGGVDADRTAMARATRDLRYYSARRSSAQLTQPDPTDDAVQFGCIVGVERQDGRRQSFQIVGEDEADPGEGLIFYASPLARAVLGRCEGEEAQLGEEELQVLTVRRR